ncbi:hypothetical protein AN218_15410 [Streptomyces nanshensis]|uniref:Uncharacterized protein n=2 Tax=Streptomyces nanshensis TaxID=518642 RepID=A0A1E7L414_9ACTN|nr:hypothetical protein AN218_15410 [Streptomyces nanshensis]
MSLPIVFVRGDKGPVGYEVHDRYDRSVSYGFVWDGAQPCHWVAMFPDDSRPGNGGGIPGFASRMTAGLFLYRFNKPVSSGR